MTIKIFSHGKPFTKKLQTGTLFSSLCGELFLLIHCYLGVVTFLLRLKVYFVKVLLNLRVFFVYFFYYLMHLYRKCWKKNSEPKYEWQENESFYLAEIFEIKVWRHWETTWELWKYYFHSSPSHLWKFNFNFNILKARPFEMITASYIMDVTHSVNEGSYQGEGRVSLFDLTRCSIIFLTVHSSPVAVDHVGNTRHS